MKSFELFGVRLDALSMKELITHIDAAIKAKTPGFVCFCTVNNMVEALRSPQYVACLSRASLRLLDGMPLVWLAHRAGIPHAEQLCGPDVLPRLCEHSVGAQYRHYFIGGGPGVAEALACSLRARYPGLIVAGFSSPPFHPVSPSVDETEVQRIADACPDIVWVGLGSPKQDMWMCAHRDRIPAIMLGVGAAFDFHTGAVQRAPRWMTRRGLEWVYRLAKEPGRLWRRYLVGNAVFMLHLVPVLLGRNLRSRQEGRGANESSNR